VVSQTERKAIIRQKLQTRKNWLEGAKYKGMLADEDLLEELDRLVNDFEGEVKRKLTEQ
jgi:hypothetical protein